MFPAVMEYLVFLIQGLSLASLYWLVSEPSDPPALASLVLGFQVCATVPWFLCGFWGSNSGPQVAWEAPHQLSSSPQASQLIITSMILEHHEASLRSKGCLYSLGHWGHSNWTALNSSRAAQCSPGLSWQKLLSWSHSCLHLLTHSCTLGAQEAHTLLFAPLIG